MLRARHHWALSLLMLACLNSQAQTIEGVTEESSYVYMDQGRVAGVASRIVEAVFKQAGLDDYHLTIYPWARAYDRALREPNVLIYPILRNPERESLFKWVGDLETARPVFFKLREHTNVQVGSLADAKNYVVGVVRDDYREKYLHDQGFTRLVVSANNRENFSRLIHGQVELVPMPERDARKLCADAQLPFDTLEAADSTMDGLNPEIFMAFSRATDDAVVQRARDAYDTLKRDGTITRMLREGP